MELGRFGTVAHIYSQPQLGILDVLVWLGLGLGWFFMDYNSHFLSNDLGQFK